MKKILLGILFIFLLVLTACESLIVVHPTRETPTEEEQIEIVKQVKSSTVAIHGSFMEFETSLGSGILFMREESPSGKYYYYVVTNHHVVQGATSVKVVTDFDIIELGDVYITSLTNDPPSFEDIAIVRFESEFDYPLINIIPFNDPLTVVRLSIGQTVFGIGSPSNKANFNLMTNYGVISDISNFWISHTANINPGNSGGPLFSYDGTFIGINTQRIEKVGGDIMYLLSETINVNQVANMIEVRFDQVKPKFGIQVYEMETFLLLNTEGLADFDPTDYVESNIDGIVVLDTSVTRPSHGILQMYDVIIEVNGVTITSLDDFSYATNPIEIGDVYEVVVSRKNDITQAYEHITLEVEITHV